MWMLLQASLVAFAVARLTRLLTPDEISRPAREYLTRGLPEGSRLAYLFFCRWCVSVWVAIPIGALWWAYSCLPRWSGHWWIDVPTTALALSYATGLLVRAEPEA